MNNDNFKLLPYFIGMVVTLIFNVQTIYAQIDWIKRDSDPGKYKMGIDSSIQHDNKQVMTIKSIDSKIQGYGDYRTNFKPGQYLGKRVRMTGYMKSKNVADWAGFWFTVEEADTLKNALAFDNMEDRPVKGTTGWNKYTLVFDVPDNASNITFGASLDKTGQIWFTNPIFEIVDNSVPTTGFTKNDWMKTGSDPGKYKMGIDSSIQRDKQQVMTIKSIASKIDGFGGYMKNSEPGQFLGKRVRMTGYMKSKNVAKGAGFWFRVDQVDPLNHVLSFDNMDNRPVKGTTGWKKYAVVLDVADNASNIASGALLKGTGQIWFSNPDFEIVDNSVPTTKLYPKNDSELVAVTPQPCEKEPTMRSLNHNTSMLLRFRNNTSGNITVYWINYSGQRDTSAEQIRHVAPGEFVETQTFLTHPFIVVGAGGKCYGIYKSTANPSIAIIKD